MIHIGWMLLYGMAFAFVIMLLLWLVQRKTGNAGIVDIGWSGTIPVLAIFYAVWASQPLPLRTALILGMAVLWGGRLVLHIHKRSHGKPEDARYTELRQAWGKRTQIKLLVFFQFQAAAAVLFSLPFLLALGQISPALTPLEYTGLALWLLAWLGEAAADRQLARFKQDPANKGSVCESGWWNYSRHPNYFFEWLIWVALALFCWDAPYGYLALVCPILMLFFLFKVTGIPATEEQALKSKGDRYRMYQKTTSPFVPWFKKRL